MFNPPPTRRFACNYFDGFVVRAEEEAGRLSRMAKTASKVWRDHGALEYVECIADDVKPGKVTSPRRASN
jgi:uncharacterized protein YbaA (DUF1428 family)